MEASTSSKPSIPSHIPTVTGLTSSKLIVNRKQQGNPVLKYVRAVPYEWSSEIRPDYLCGMCGILYLTLKWHKLHPSYLETRLNDLTVYDLKILLVLNNVEDPSYLLKDLNILCYRSHWTMVVAQSVEEAGEYIENLKLSERRNPADTIRTINEYKLKRKNDGKPLTVKEKHRQNYESAVKFLSSIKGITVSDAKRLLGSFGSIQTISKCSVDQINLCPGLGPTKSQRLYEFFRLSLINIKSK
ncbi:unnamed protein product [Bursaphelenchus xylophilus]|uniref:(pine wood nematode) hypothetical protein n=1 Tax=Bursaphelenchus xylophilus TaxID=6326 RepID=A0A1I7RYC5_BURXY|nr:unnamed protein product [Bursaphelenchus xylophilus]CAG9085589.1 unnamed protein product [Bursaphelenchus xylophilus]